MTPHLRTATQAEKEAITDIGKRVNMPNLAEAIEQACLNQQAFFFGFEAGFFILCPKGEGLLIWAMHTTSPMDRLGFNRLLETMGQEVGAKYLEFYTARKGAAKVASRYGFSGTSGVWNGTPITIWRKQLC